MDIITFQNFYKPSKIKKNMTLDIETPQTEVTLEKIMNGGLVAAKIISTFPKNGGFGYFYFEQDKIDIFVGNGAPHVGENCLVRFDHQYRTEKLRKTKPECTNIYKKSNYITNEIPDDFFKMTNSEFILFGQWQDHWLKSGRVPTLHEVNNHYEPGSIGTFVYFDENGGSYFVNSYRANPTRGTEIRNALRSLPYPHTNSRVVISPSRDILNKVEETIREVGCHPIELKPFRTELKF